jgi:predicted dithiol-disulfide oxidoreductase (DUF899 family)
MAPEIGMCEEWPAARLELLWGMSQWLDRAPKGRETGRWFRLHNEYG